MDILSTGVVEQLKRFSHPNYWPMHNIPLERRGRHHRSPHTYFLLLRVSVNFVRIQHLDVMTSYLLLI